MIGFDVILFCVAIVCVVFAWIPATMYIGDFWLAPLLERFGKRQWYLSRPHRIFWYATMILPFIGGIGLILFSPAILLAYSWLFLVSVITLIVYGVIGLIHYLNSVESVWFCVALWPLFYIF